MKQTILAVCLVLIAVTSVNANWGVDSGRANLTDAQELIRDYIQLVKARERIEQASQLGLIEERQKALLGADRVPPKTANILQAMADVLYQQIVVPAQAIARNPAASCAEANITLTELRRLNRISQLFGLDESMFKYDAEYRALVNTRCREEALDECNLTGRYAQILQRANEEARSLELLNGGEGKDDVSKWVISSMKECANYELHYTSTSTIKEQFTLESKVTGKVFLHPDDPPYYLGIRVIGRTEGAENPFLQNLKCTGDKTTKITCAPGGGAIMGAVAEIDLLDLVHTVYYTDIVDLSGWQANGAMQKSKKEGETKLEFRFGPAMMLVPSVIEYIGANTDGSGRTPPMNVPIEVGGTAFSTAYAAYQSGAKRGQEEQGQATFNFTMSKSGVYPGMFDGEVTRTNNNATDTTQFQLIHTPHKKPFPPREGEGPKKKLPLRPKRPV